MDLPTGESRSYSVDLAIHLELVLWSSWDWLPGVVSFFSMLVQRKLLLFSPSFLPLSILFSGGRGCTDSPEMCRYRSARVPQVCIEFWSRIIYRVVTESVVCCLDSWATLCLFCFLHRKATEPSSPASPQIETRGPGVPVLMGWPNLL